MDDLINEVVWEDGNEQLRFTVSEFLDKQYLSLRYWYLDFDEEWHPTNKGVTFPYTAELVTYLVAAFSKLLSDTEIEMYFPSSREI